MTALALGLAGIIGLSSAHADTGDRGSSLIDRLVTKFNLNRDEVQAVFDEEHTARMAEHEQEMEDRLAQAVTDGKLTQEQADLISSKFEEEKSFRESLKDLSEEQRREALKTHMDELKTWAEENDIPFGFLHLGGPGKHGHFGHGGMGMMGGRGEI